MLFNYNGVNFIFVNFLYCKYNEVNNIISYFVWIGNWYYKGNLFNNIDY